MRGILKNIYGKIQISGQRITSNGFRNFSTTIFKYVYFNTFKLYDDILRYLLPANIYILFRTTMNTIGYEDYAVADPYRLLYVDPDSINTYIDGKYSIMRYYYTNDISDGDWDKNPQLFEDNIIYTTLRQKYVKDRRWIDTSLVSDSIDNNRSWRGATSKKDIFTRCEKMDDLYETLCETGYRESSQVSELKYPYSLFDNVNIAIGRDGQMILTDGRHRLSMAKIIGFDKIPVRVVARHEDWHHKRKQLIEGDHGEFEKEYRSHPDMGDIFNTNNES